MRRVPEKRPPSKILIADDKTTRIVSCSTPICRTRVTRSRWFTTGNRQTADAVAASQPDLILLDIMMPKVSGYEVCQRLKADPDTRKIPVIMVTALAEMGDIEKAVNAGADDFLTKPVNKLELTTRVRFALRYRDLSNERDRLLKYIEGVDGTHDRGPEEDDHEEGREKP